MSKEFLYSNPDWTEEFLRDPAYWMEAEVLEAFLKAADVQVHGLEKVAHKVAELRSWGPLDSVLKMIGRPSDILSQPERFLSYFIAPPPPIEVLNKTEESIRFQIPISKDEYPYTTQFLKAAFEAIPTYLGQTLVNAKWEDCEVSINWSTQQTTLFQNQDTEPNLNPELLRQMMANLEMNQKEIEEKNKALFSREKEIERLQKELEQVKLCIVSQSTMLEKNKDDHNEKVEKTLFSVSHNVAKLQDYLVRSQQIVTILSSAQKKSPHVQQIMHRVDWDHLVKEYPVLIRDTLNELTKLRQDYKANRSVEAIKEKEIEIEN